MKKKFYTIRSSRLKLFLAIGLLSFGLIYSINILAYRSGISGQTDNGCTCHGSRNTNTTLTPISQSNSWTVEAGSTNRFSVRVNNSGFNYAGVNIAVKTSQTGGTNAGTLNPVSGSGLQTSDGELVHSEPKNYSNYASFDFTWTAPTTPGTYYLRAVGNAVNNNNQSSGDQWNFMTVQEITVVSSPTITVVSPNGGEVICPESSYNIRWNASNVSNVKILLSTDGGNTFNTTLVASISASAGSWTWNVPSNITPGNTYKIRIESTTNSNIKDESDGNFTIGSATTIRQHPQSQRVCAGTSVEFSVSATGNNLVYRWRKNGQDVPGANSATLIINPVTSQSAGTYDCIVTGACGAPQTSNPATLTVDNPPSITTQPVSQAVCEGKSATFSVVAEGTDISYQWRKNGAIIPNATNPTYTIQSVSSNDEGEYEVVITGKCPPVVVSQKARLEVLKSPTILVQPKILNACEGEKVFLFVKAEGSGLNFTWVKDGQEIPGTNNDTLFFDNLKASDSGFYLVRIVGTCGNPIESQSVKLTVNLKPIITKHPESQTISQGSTLALSVAAKGENLRYQWKKDGKIINGATQPTLVIQNIQLSDSGNYFVEVTNNCGTTLSNSAKIVVKTSSSNARLQYSLDTLKFGAYVVGKSIETTFSAVLKNVGTEELVINSFQISGSNANDFNILSNFPIKLIPNATADLKIKFTPSSEGERFATIFFNSNSAVSIPLPLFGYGLKNSLQFTPSKLVFTFNQKGIPIVKNLEMKNLTSGLLTVSLNIVGEDSKFFKIVSDKEFQFPSNSTKTIAIEFSGEDDEPKSLQLIVNVVETNEQFSIPITTEFLSSVLEGISNLTIYPNPTNNEVNIQIEKFNQNLEIRIFSQEGILVNKIKTESKEGLLTWDLKDTFGNSIANGVYYCVISDGINFQVIKLIVSR
ncbi:MAG: immunoglobulin domain-containing protein [Ignavibacteria bacterium]|nr:immunoglobulin domain-containing protein [Ignavibacteria bacterium]